MANVKEGARILPDYLCGAVVHSTTNVVRAFQTFEEICPIKFECMSLRITVGSITAPKKHALRKSTAVRFAVRSRDLN